MSTMRPQPTITDLSKRYRSSFIRALPRGVEDGENPGTCFRSNRRRGALGGRAGEGLIVIVIPALLGANAFVSGSSEKRAPVRFRLVAPGRRVMGRTLAGKDRLRLDIRAVAYIRALITIGAQFPQIVVVQLAGRDVAVAAVFVARRNGEAGVRPPFRQIDVVELSIDFADRAKSQSI